TGVNGMAIIRAILRGKTNPKELAKMRDPRCKQPIEVIESSLQGNYREEHLFALQQAVNAYDFYQNQIRECDEAVKKNSKC
ncbi:IS110 family transposase, partial [Staphylococcus aureus]|nr:IS110 family transposase [Staphylococcus aureus]